MAVSVMAAASLTSGCTTTPPEPSTLLDDGRIAMKRLDAISKAYGSRMVSCLADLGFDSANAGVAPLLDGGFSATVPPHLQARYDDAVDVCNTRTGFADPPTELTPGMLMYLYSRYVATHHCLVDHGYSPSPKVSQQSFVDSEGENWQPYDGLVEAGADPSIFQATCPVEI